ncbi:unnamed protein product [Caenorhabditis sp. 36 PRJEB53466]|nr:unnamed protein product [Caenorhabditis sp. 36 PRJEB53466]
MIVVYGKPKSFKSVQTNSSVSWDDCVKLCWSNSSCVLAYDKNNTCQWFKYGNISTVTQTTKTQGFKVAFKINITSATCPTGTNPPTFNNKTASVSLETPDEVTQIPIRVNYTIKLVNGTWTFTFVVKNACPLPQYSFTRRPSMDWCLLPLYTNISQSYDDAVAGCATQGCILTGASNADEVEYLVVSAKLIRTYTISRNIYLRIDGVRSTKCQSTPKTAACKTSSGFTYGDSSSKTIDYYNWVTNAGAQASTGDNCLVVRANGTSSILEDVRSCTSTTALPVYGFVCGRQAWVW